MKPHRFRHALLVTLVLTLLCGIALLSLPVSAAEGESAFMGTVFYGSNGMTCRLNDGRIILPMGENGQSVAYFAATTPAVYDTPNNAVRFVLTNYGASTFFHLQYTYQTEEGTQTETIRVDIGSYNGRCTYVVRIDEVDRLQSMVLTLPGYSGSSLVLHAMEAVRVWSPTEEEHGTVTACTYHSGTRTITVKGSVYHDIMIAAGGGTLGLYRLATGQTVDELLADKEATPLVTSSLSIGFQLQTPAPDLASRYARYVVLIDLPDGTRLPLGGAHYAVAASQSTLQNASRQDFKGIDTTLTSSAIDSNVGSAIVDVYLNRLENDKQSGYLYTVENEYFYFNRAYLAELDATIRSLSGAACRVYLRFLVESEINEDIVQDGVSTAALDPARYVCLRADDEASLKALYAYTSFLCNRYAGGSQGEVDGIIVGTRVDCSAVYNAAGSLTLDEYTVAYGRALSTVMLAARDVTPSLVIAVPVSDGWNAESIGTTYRRGNYTSELFLESLSCYLTTHGAGKVVTMIESTHNPYGLNNDYFTPVNTDGDDTVLGEQLPKLTAADWDTPYLSSENITLLDTYLMTYSARYSSLSGSYLFHWSPDANTDGSALSASYVYHYYRLFCDTRAEGFFVSFRERELAGDTATFSKIKYLVKYIDTSSGSLRTEFALSIFNTEAWGQIIPEFKRAAIEQVMLTESVFTPHNGEHVSGRYHLFDFSTANSTRGWYTGNNCLSLGVVTSEHYGKTLDAEMRADRSTLAEYSDIAYRFSRPLSLRYSPYLTMTVSVDCPNDPEAVFEVKLVLGSDTGYAEAKQVVKNGETVTVTLNAEQFAEVDEIEYLRLSAKTVMGGDETFTVHLGSLTLESLEYDDAALEKLVGEWLQERDTTRYHTTTQQIDPLMPVIMIGMLLIATVVVALMLHHYQKNADVEEED